MVKSAAGADRRENRIDTGGGEKFVHLWPIHPLVVLRRSDQREITVSQNKNQNRVCIQAGYVVGKARYGMERS